MLQPAELRDWRQNFGPRLFYACCVYPNRPSFWASSRLCDFRVQNLEGGTRVYQLLPETEKSCEHLKAARPWFCFPLEMTPVLDFYFATGRRLMGGVGLSEDPSGPFLLNTEGSALLKDRMTLWFQKFLYDSTGCQTSLRDYRLGFSAAIMESELPMSTIRFVVQQLRHTYATAETYYLQRVKSSPAPRPLDVTGWLLPVPLSEKIVGQNLLQVLEEAIEHHRDVIDKCIETLAQEELRYRENVHARLPEKLLELPEVVDDALLTSHPRSLRSYKTLARQNTGRLGKTLANICQCFAFQTKHWH